VEPDPALGEAQRELFAARFENAVTLYSKIVEQWPAEADAWYGLVRARLGQHRSREAYTAAGQALDKAPQTAGAETAAGLAMYRRGDLPKAEAHYQAALKIKQDYPGALREMASIYSAISLFKSARDLRLKAYSASPDDPRLMLAHANTLKGQEHIAALQETLARLDPASEEARSLRVHIANDRAVGGRKLKTADESLRKHAD
jgi:tetratricopeptide (TPR) repeat protein